MTNEELVYKIQHEENREQYIEMLYNQNRGLINSVARRYKPYAEEEDLRQEGFLSLLKAAQEYNPEREASFSTFAVRCLKTDLYRYVINSGRTIRLPEWLYQQVMKYRRLLSAYEKAGGTAPTVAQVAAIMGISESQAEDVISESQAMRLASIDALVHSPDGNDDMTLADMLPSPESMEDDALDRIQNEELTKVIWSAVDSLPGRQPEVIRERYQQGKTRQAVAEDLNISSQAVARIEHEALRALKKGRRGKALRAFWEITATAYRHVSVGNFQRTSTSATERAAMLLEMVQKKDIDYTKLLRQLKEEATPYYGDDND